MTALGRSLSTTNCLRQIYRTRHPAAYTQCSGPLISDLAVRSAIVLSKAGKHGERGYRVRNGTHNCIPSHPSATDSASTCQYDREQLCSTLRVYLHAGASTISAP